MVKEAQAKYLTNGKEEQTFLKKGACPDGYKLTEVGVIPSDWSVEVLLNIVVNNRISSGLYKEKNTYGEGTKIIKLGDVFKHDYFKPDDAQRVNLSVREIEDYQVKIGDIFIALASVKLEGVGKVMLVENLDEKTVFDHNVALIRTVNSFHSKFIHYFLTSNFIRNEVAKLATQVGTTFLKATSILKFT